MHHIISYYIKLYHISQLIPFLAHAHLGQLSLVKVGEKKLGKYGEKKPVRLLIWEGFNPSYVSSEM